MDHSDGAVECNDEGYHEEGQCYYAEGFPPCKACHNLAELSIMKCGDVVPIAMILDANCHVAALQIVSFDLVEYSMDGHT